MRWLGGFLPFVGFRLLDLDAMAARQLLGHVPNSPVGLWEAFEIEWLGEGITVCVRPVLEIVD